MLISLSKKFVFIANSKTASTSFEKLLKPHAEIKRGLSAQRKHISWMDARKEYGCLFGQPEFPPASFFKFGVVREPASWVLSWYNYRLGNKRVPLPIPADTSFADWWHGKDWVKNLSQAKYFVDDQGEGVMDLLIPLDALGEALPLLLARLGVPDGVLERENKSPGKMKLADVPAELVQEIRAHYAADMKLYEHWKTKWRTVLPATSVLTAEVQ